MKKKKTLPKVLKETQALVNKLARERDGKCMRCGNTSTLQAHHFIVAQGSSSLHRFELSNLISLCYGCHIHWLHANPTIDRIDEIREIALKSKICTKEDIAKIISGKGQSKKWTRYELEELQDKCKEILSRKIS